MNIEHGIRMEEVKSEGAFCGGDEIIIVTVVTRYNRYKCFMLRSFHVTRLRSLRQKESYEVPLRELRRSLKIIALWS